MKAPAFWETDGPLARLLSPLGDLVAGVGRARRHHIQPAQCGRPVLCVGNLTAGGQGKTPTALALAGMVRAEGAEPWFLTRGYGGSLAGPVRVAADHGSEEVGDEALLLAEAAPTIVSSDRAAGAALAVAGGAGAIIMDDGFQNPALHKDFSLVVVDGGSGFGNGRTIPAGPLREPVAEGLARAQGLVLIGPDRHGIAGRLPGTLPLFEATLEPVAPERFAGRAVVGFAGIGRPAKFFDTLDGCGAVILDRRAFPDHHRFTPSEIDDLLRSAEQRKAILVTTAKDHVRLPAEIRPRVEVLSVGLVFARPAALAALLGPILD